MSTTQEVKLRCDMRVDCEEPVTHIDEKGWVYCARHAIQRKYYHRCRKLQPEELRRLKAGKTIHSYEDAL